MDHEDIIERACESIMQRANDTYPRTLHKDMLRDEIGKAIKEATRHQGWPPPVALGDLGLLLTAEDILEPVDGNGYSVLADALRHYLHSTVTYSHDRMRANLQSLSSSRPCPSEPITPQERGENAKPHPYHQTYYGKPE